MKNKCKSYHLQPKTRYTYNPLTGSPIAHDIEVGVCWGTKECDECFCGGDETKCDFYPKVREKAKNKKCEDSLIITYDNYPPDVPTLMVARKDKYDMTILNKIQGDEAYKIYCYLIRNEYPRNNDIKTNANNIRSVNDEELAKILVDIGWDCNFCSEHERLENEPLLRGERCDEQCVKHCSEWLKKTVEK